ncbi:MAG: carbonic anhydrase [Ruminococcaceae bacterium]|nr:carbonic anhydrase [Oscillospiraceae bacterium]
MDYKKIIKSYETRARILRFLSFVPDKPMLKLQYYIKTGRQLNLKNPQRFTEKLQWYKLYYKDPLMIRCVDKYDVREYVKSKGLEDILIPCYGVFDSVEEIEWDKLPNQFVIKDTLGGGGNAVMFVDDKSRADFESLKELASTWTAIDNHVRDGGREWPYYSGKKHRIIIEEMLKQPDGDLADYKFFCFSGRVMIFYIRTGYNRYHACGKMSFFTRERQWLKGVGMDYCAVSDIQQNLPNNISDMIECAEKLSTGFPHARIDLYCVDSKIYFGEITFFNASGYMKFDPDSFDIELGNMFPLSAEIKEEY